MRERASTGNFHLVLLFGVALWVCFKPAPRPTAAAMSVLSATPLSRPRTLARAHIVILQIDAEKTPHCSLAAPKWNEYADMHNIKLHWITQAREGYDPKIQKYAELGKIFRSVPERSLVLLSDCDIAVTNMSRSIYDVWYTHATNYNASLIVAQDPAYQSRQPFVPINSGFMLFQNTKWSRNFVASVTAHGPVTDKIWQQGDLVDQPIVTKILVQQNELRRWKTQAVLQPGQSHTVVVSNRVMNSFYRPAVFFDSKEFHWQKGDWVAHVSGDSWLSKTFGTTTDNRVARMKEVLNWD